MESMRPGLMMGRMNSVTSLSPDLVGNGSLRKWWIIMNKSLRRHRFFRLVFALFLWDKLLLSNTVLINDYCNVKSSLPSPEYPVLIAYSVCSYCMFTGTVWWNSYCQLNAFPYETTLFHTHIQLSSLFLLVCFMKLSGLRA